VAPGANAPPERSIVTRFGAVEMSLSAIVSVFLTVGAVPWQVIGAPFAVTTIPSPLRTIPTASAPETMPTRSDPSSNRPQPVVASAGAVPNTQSRAVRTRSRRIVMGRH
jgi:hypothetical protein